MAIKIGNTSLNEVYIGNTAIKEIYAGSSLVWRVSPPSLIITLDTSAVTEDLQYYYVCIYVNGNSTDTIYFDADEAYLNNSDYYFSNNQCVYSKVSDGDVVKFAFYKMNGNDIAVQMTRDGVDMNVTQITINGQTNVKFIAEDVTPAPKAALFITLDTSNVTEDLGHYYIPFFINGNYVNNIYFSEDIEGYHFYNNRIFGYDHILNGDIVTFGAVCHLAQDYPLIQMTRDGVDISQTQITVNGWTEVEFTVEDATYTPVYIDNEIYIPYSEINRMFGDIFSSSLTRYSNKVLSVHIDTNYSSYDVTYTQDNYDLESRFTIVSNLGILSDGMEHPDSDSTYTFKYFDSGLVKTVTESGTISFTRSSNNYIGTIE